MHPETQHAVDRLRAAVASGEEIKVSPSEAYLLLQAVENFSEKV